MQTLKKKKNLVRCNPKTNKAMQQKSTRKKNTHFLNEVNKNRRETGDACGGEVGKK